MKHVIVADFTDMDDEDVERMLGAAGYDPTRDRLVAFGPMGSLQVAEYLFQALLEARGHGNENGVVILPSGKHDEEVFLELKVSVGGEAEQTEAINEIIRTTDKVRSLPLDATSAGRGPRVAYLTYDGFEILTGIQRFDKVKELIQTSNFSPHAFLSIIRPLYVAYQDMARTWIIQPMPDTASDYIHCRRLVVFKGVRADATIRGKVVTLNKVERDLGVCHSQDVLIQHPGGAYVKSRNVDHAYANILSFVRPTEQDLERVARGETYYVPLASGYSHLVNLGRACRGHYALMDTSAYHLNDLLVEHGLPLLPDGSNAPIPGIAFFNTGDPPDAA